MAPRLLSRPARRPVASGGYYDLDRLPQALLVGNNCGRAVAVVVPVDARCVGNVPHNSRYTIGFVRTGKLVPPLRVATCRRLWRRGWGHLPWRRGAVITSSCGPPHRREPTALGSCRHLGPLGRRWGSHRHKRRRCCSWDRPMAHCGRAARSRHGAGCVPRVAAATPTPESELDHLGSSWGGREGFRAVPAGLTALRCQPRAPGRGSTATPRP